VIRDGGMYAGYRDLVPFAGNSGPGWPAPGRSLADLQRLLDAHNADGGRCAAGCQHAGPVCATWSYAWRERRRLLHQRWSA
jgi:hypothetical protein